MSIISGVGLTSGIDYNSIISKLLEVERVPINMLERRKSDYNDKITVYNDLESKLESVMNAVDKLRTSTRFYEKTVSVSDNTIISATVSNSAAAGMYVIEPHSVAGKIQLASADRRTGTTSFSSTTDVVNNSGADQVFEYTYGGSTISLTIANGATLEELRDAINNDTDNPGITATIINVGTNDYRLVLTGKDTGSSNTITITSNTTLTGFSDSDFTASSAQDAKFSIGGIDVVKSSNTFSDVIPGVTITLKSESTSSVTITVNNDVDTIKQNIEDFVSAYNNLVDYIDTKTEYSTLTNTGEELADETIPDRILSRLKSILTSRVAGQPEDLRTLAQLGITTDYQTGHLEIDSSTLTDKLTNDLETVETLFTNSTNGIANELYNYLDDVTDSASGPIAVRIDGLENMITDINNNINNMEEHLTKMELNLRRQFAALESMLTELSGQSSFLSRLLTK